MVIRTFRSTHPMNFTKWLSRLRQRQSHEGAVRVVVAGGICAKGGADGCNVERPQHHLSNGSRAADENVRAVVICGEASHSCLLAIRRCESRGARGP